VRQFQADPEIQATLREATRNDTELEALGRRFTPEGVERLKKLPLDRIEIAKWRPRYERLDQLVVELLLGVR
jgi:xylose isomerase